MDATQVWYQSNDLDQDAADAAWERQRDDSAAYAQYLAEMIEQEAVAEDQSAAYAAGMDPSEMNGYVERNRRARQRMQPDYAVRLKQEGE